MSYLGRGLDKISNIEILDNITFDGSSSYSITKSSVAFVPNSAQSLLISIDGVVQATNFTVSSSTIDFGVAVPSTSTCDFFLHYGTGVAFIPADGTVTSSKISYPLTTFSSTGIDDNASSTAITIDSSQNIGIGNTSPDHKVTITGSSSQGTLGLYTSGTSNELRFENDANQNWIISNQTQGLRFKAAGTDRMRIDASSGSIRIGSNNSYGLNEKVMIYGSSTANQPTILSSKEASGTASSNHVLFQNTNGTVGSIETSGSATSYVTSSDYRLKENVNYDFDATTRLKKLKPARFNFIADANTTVDGFLAHEVSSIVPEAISGEKDATETKEKVVINSNGHVIAENIEQADWEAGKIADEDGNTQYPTDSTWEATKVVPIYQGIDQSKLVPLLVKTIQELEARITALENA